MMSPYGSDRVKTKSLFYLHDFLPIACYYNESDKNIDTDLILVSPMMKMMMTMTLIMMINDVNNHKNYNNASGVDNSIK